MPRVRRMSPAAEAIPRSMAGRTNCRRWAALSLEPDVDDAAGDPTRQWPDADGRDQEGGCGDEASTQDVAARAGGRKLRRSRGRAARPQRPYLSILSSMSLSP